MAGKGTQTRAGCIEKDAIKGSTPLRFELQQRRCISFQGMNRLDAKPSCIVENTLQTPS